MVRPEPSIVVRSALGAGLVLGVGVACEAFSRGVVRVPSPGVFLVLSVAFAGFAWGLAAALAAVPAVACAACYLYADAGAWARYTPDNAKRIVVLIAGAAGVAVLVGVLRARADRALRAVTDRYAALLHATPDAVLVQQDERIAYANDAAHELFGAAAGGLVGGSIWARIDPGSQAAVRARMPLIGQGGGHVPPIEETWVRVDGSTFAAEVTARGVRFSGRPAALVVVHDLTQRRAMEGRIRQQVSDLSLLQEVSRAFLFGLSPGEIPEYLCALVAERLGVGRAWVARVAADGALTPPLGDACEGVADEGAGADLPLELVRRAIRGARPACATEPVAGAARAGYRSMAAFPLISGDQVIAVLAVASTREAAISDDRVELIQSLANLSAIALAAAEAHAVIARRADELELAVARRTEELRAAGDEMKAFTYSVSHDLRAPLRAICGFSEIVLRRHADAIPPEAHRYLENIVGASGHMSKLIDDLLAYARLGRRGADYQPTDLADLVGRIVVDLGARAQEKGATLTTPANLPVIRSDVTLLRQVLTNLLDNALTYHAPGAAPVVALTVEASAAETVFRVSDQGIGVAPEHLDSIFNIFQRLHSADEYPGTGIGLAIVRKSVALLGGTVGIESAVGRGSTFTVRLPAGPGVRAPE